MKFYYRQPIGSISSYIYLISNASELHIPELNCLDYGWEINKISNIVQPIWDTQGNINNIDLLLQATMQKCSCKKNKMYQ